MVNSLLTHTSSEPQPKKRVPPTKGGELNYEIIVLRGATTMIREGPVYLFVRARSGASGRECICTTVLPNGIT